MNKRMQFLSVAVMLALTSALAGCGAKTNTAGTNTTSSDTTAPSIKVGLVTDTGGLNDHGFNHLADLGLQKAISNLGIKGDVVQSTSSSDYVPNLTNFARNGYKLVIAVGYLMQDAVESVAKQYPNTKFLIIDSEIKDRTNVVSALFKTEQCGYLAGVMSGLMQKHQDVQGINSKNTVGVVGGMNIPPVTSYIAGFQQGMKAVDPSGKILVSFAGKFDDQALGSQIAQSQIGQGADIVFQVAGGTGIGVIDAAQKAKVLAIGVDADQNYVAPNTVITSALKGVDTATFDVIKDVKNNTFKSGDKFFDLANNGVGLGIVNKLVPKDVMDQVNSYAGKIKNGQLTVSPNMSK